MVNIIIMTYVSKFLVDIEGFLLGADLQKEVGEYQLV